MLLAVVIYMSCYPYAIGSSAGTSSSSVLQILEHSDYSDSVCLLV